MRHILIATLLSVMVGGMFAASDEVAPADIEQLFDDFFREYIELSPETGTTLGLPDILEIPVRNDELDDVSDEGIDKLFKLYKKYRDRLSKFDKTKLTPSQLLNYNVLMWFLNDELQREEYRYHRYIINPMFSFHNQLTTLLTGHHKIETLGDAIDYLKRLQQYDKKVTQLIEQIKKRQQRNIMPPDFIIETFLEELDRFTELAYDENVLFVSFQHRVNNLTTLTGSTKEELCQKVLKALEDYVYPAYKRMSDYVESLKEKANEDAGVWKLTNGDEYYKFCLRHHTTTNMTPDEIHELGLKEVKRIQNEMKKYYETLGLPADKDFADLTAEYWQLVTDRDALRYFYPDTDEGKKQTLRDYQKIIDDVNTRLSDIFSIFPKASVQVKRVPEFKKKTAGTYYERAKLDRSSGGIFFANLSYQHFKPGMKTLTYHEAVPGHHFQITIGQESSDYRLFRSLTHFTGYLEGWALYAEKLAKEYGFYEDVHSKIGNLRSELFRAARLVVDTGIHHKRWTREEAYEYMRNNVGWASYGEIGRYIVWPGQACAYKVGELTLLKLRQKVKKELGDKYDIKDFHTVILQHGSLPLEILSQLVDQYIEATKAE